jgi:L-aminoadipate-semialdehyde dehydrogenase
MKQMTSQDVLRALGFSRSELAGGSLAVHSPIYGAEIARIAETPVSEVSAVIAAQRPTTIWSKLDLSDPAFAQNQLR